MQYTRPMQSSTVELNLMYVAGSLKIFGYNSSYWTPLARTASGVGM